MRRLACGAVPNCYQLDNHNVSGCPLAALLAIQVLDILGRGIIRPQMCSIRETSADGFCQGSVGEAQ
ncbi:hypothetical protein TNCV_2999701 [Trichonephila clavipes]|nr:hypothetical protein TNCV_2999701 [Trichonephila clavipes]